MSSFEADPEVGPARPAAMELLEGAPVALGGPRGFAVTRTLPNRQRRMAEILANGSAVVFSVRFSIRQRCGSIRQNE